MKMLRIGCLSGILALALGASAWGAEIPAVVDASAGNRDQAVQALEQAGLPHDAAVSQAQSMDRVELAQLGRTDLTQQGGDTIVAIAVIAAIVVLVYILIDHMDRNKI